MAEDILDNVKELLNKEIGDKKVLEQIKRAAENNEAISNYERNYVSKLIEDLRKPPEPEIEITVEEPSEISSPQEHEATVIIAITNFYYCRHTNLETKQTSK